MSKEMKRGEDRRQSEAWFSSLTHDRRRAHYERRGQEPVKVAPGELRPGFGEAAPLVERRRLVGAGLE